MADTLKSIVSFVGVAPDAVVAAPHKLRIRSTPLKPDEVKFHSSGAFQFISADTTTLTIRNVGTSLASCDCLCEAWHPIERLFGSVEEDGSFSQHLVLQPFAASGGAGSVISPEVFPVTNTAGVAILAGSPVTALGRRGDASTLGTSVIVGFAQADTDPTMPIPVQGGGALSLPTTTWDTVTGQVGGLTPGARYVLATTPGGLSTSAPTAVGNAVTALGTSRDATTLILEIAQPILL